MSTLGKGLLIFALIGGIASVVLGYLVSQGYDTARSDSDTAKQKAATAEKTLGQTKAQLEDAKTAQQAAEQKAATDDQKVSDLNNQLTSAQKDEADAKAALSKAQSDATDAQKKFDDLNTQLDGQTPQQMKDAISSAQKDRDTAQSQLKIVQDALQQAQQRVTDLVSDINNSKKGIIPPGVSGKVTFVDRTWNFVVLDVGLDSGVVPNGELIVYRGRTFLGKVRVTRADPGDSVAEILPDLKGNIQVGDAVLN
jgi:multidrug efflux pump subunit AcrA (membrane-fusion protein)